MELRIGTYNIQHGILFTGERKGEIDTRPAAELIRSAKLDICGFNEIFHKGKFGNQAKPIADALGYEYAFACAATSLDYAGEGCEYGNAIVSRYPILSVRTVLIPIPETPEEYDPNLPAWFYQEDRVLLVTEIDVNGRTVTVMNCHFGLTHRQLERATEIVLGECRKVKTPLVLMGDFNCNPSSAYYAALAEQLTDTLAVLVGDDRTFPSHAPEQKIDYIFTNGNAIRATRAEVIPVAYYDHRPLVASFAF